VEHAPRAEHAAAPAPRAAPKPAVAERPAVDALVKQGVQAYVRGDAQGALALLQKAKATRPSYAPTYRVLGQVYEKLGARKEARSSLQRYLTLAPNAADAEQVKHRLEQL
jgi:Flp pilus assembly protein TadD